MRIRTALFLLSFSFLLVNSLWGNGINRDEIIQKGYDWEIINVWSPLKETVNFPHYGIYNSFFKIGSNYYNEPYVYGGGDLDTTFQKRINNGECAGGYYTYDVYEEEFPNGVLPAQKLAGIDCSAFVSACWETPRMNTAELVSISLQLENKNQLKPGDILGIPGLHVILVLTQAQNNRITTIESTPPSIIANPSRSFSEVTSYSPYSIFPQFSNPQPTDEEVAENEQIIDISITIKASGTITSSGVSMFVNGDRISDPDLQAQDSITWQLTAQDYDVSEGGIFTVNVTARNDIAGNGYLDTYEWRFIVNNDSTPPMVFSTNPSNGEQRVPVDLNSISIKFSKSMDTVTTENAILINPDDSFSTFWGDEKTIILNLEGYLNYCEDYTVTITDEATDIDGIKLDGNTDEDGEPGGDHKRYIAG